MNLRQSYDELRKNSERYQEDHRKNLRSFEKRVPVQQFNGCEQPLKEFIHSAQKQQSL